MNAINVFTSAVHGVRTYHLHVGSPRSDTLEARRVVDLDFWCGGGRLCFAKLHGATTKPRRAALAIVAYCVGSVVRWIGIHELGVRGTDCS